VLRGIQHLDVKDGDALLLLGTTKGAFLARSKSDRKHWEVAGPYSHGHAVYSLAYDSRNGRHRLWATTSSPLWGTYLRSSDDFGRTWTNPLEANIKFPPESGLSLKNIWKITLGPPEAPDQLYCGVEPAALFESQDAAESWSLVRGLFDHPHRPRWMPGLGGLCLHTVLLHPTEPGRMHVGISAAGVYRTDDSGRTWQARNRGIRVTFMPERFPEFGQCVHKIVRHPDRPDRLFLQNHWGLYRSDDGADTWNDIAHGLPSDFGFAMVTHPHDPDCVYIVPMESDEFRCTPEGRLRVYCTRSAGASWEPLTRGLPQRGAYETVLRDGIVTDSLDPVGSTSEPAAESCTHPGTQASPGRNCSTVSRRLSVWPARSLRTLPAVPRPSRLKSGDDRLHRTRRAVSSNEKHPRDGAEAEPPMTVTFRIPGPLRSMTGGRSHVDVETSGAALRDALEALFATYPAIRDRVLTERGEIREHVNVFVGKSEARSTGGLATPLVDGMEISIIPAISGG